MKKEDNKKIKRFKESCSRNISLLDYFLSDEVFDIYLNYLESEDEKEKLDYLFKLKDIYVMNNISAYKNKKETYLKIYKVIAKENNLSLDYKKNKKLFLRYLELSKYKNYKDEIKSVDTIYKKSKTFLENIEKLIKSEKKNVDTQSRVLKDEKEELGEYLSENLSINQYLINILYNILDGKYITKYGQMLYSANPSDINKLFKKIEKFETEEKNKICILGKDILKNYMISLPKEDELEKVFVRRIMKLFEKNIIKEKSYKKDDTSAYYDILVSLSLDDRNYELIKQLIDEINTFKTARKKENHIIFYFLDEYVKNYKLKLVNQGFNYTEPDFYKEIIKLILNENNSLSSQERKEFLDIISSFLDYCKNKKYVSFNDVYNDLSEIVSNFDNESIKDENDKELLKKKTSVIINSDLPNTVRFYKDTYETVDKNTFMLDKNSKYAFSLKYENNKTIFSVHILDTSRFLNEEDELLNHQDLLIKLDDKSYYPVMSFNFTVDKNNDIEGFDIKPSLLKINEIIKENELTYNSPKYVSDMIKILDKYDETKEEYIDNYLSEGIDNTITDMISNKIVELFNERNIPFIYKNKKYDEELILKNHNLICELLYKIDKKEAHKIFDIVDEVNLNYYSSENNENSKIELDYNTMLGVYLLEVLHYLKDNNYDKDDNIKRINNCYKKLNNNKYVSKSIYDEKNKEDKKRLSITRTNTFSNFRNGEKNL